MIRAKGWRVFLFERLYQVAIERELAGRESGVESAEARIAARLDRLAREIHGITLAQQALFAFTDALAKRS